MNQVNQMNPRISLIQRLSPLVLIVSLACARTPDQPGAAPPERESTSSRATPVEAIDCGPTIVGAEPLLHEGRLVMLGEMHGSMEAPAFVAGLACQAARAGLEVQLGLEIPRREAPALAAYLDSEGDPEDRALLLAGEHWQRAEQDGRSSVAMLALIEQVRALQAAGLELEVFVFDADQWADWNERDAAMAAAILAKSEAHPRALILTLSGNLHIRAVEGLPWDANAVPMGVRVRAARPDALGLDIRHGGGAVWACQMIEGGGQSCGPMPVQGFVGPSGPKGREPGDTPRIELVGERNEYGLDGEYWLRSLSPASPAVEPASD